MMDTSCDSHAPVITHALAGQSFLPSHFQVIRPMSTHVLCGRVICMACDHVIYVHAWSSCVDLSAHVQASP